METKPVILILLKKTSNGFNALRQEQVRAMVKTMMTTTPEKFVGKVNLN